MCSTCLGCCHCVCMASDSATSSTGHVMAGHGGSSPHVIIHDEPRTRIYTQVCLSNALPNTANRLPRGLNPHGQICRRRGALTIGGPISQAPHGLHHPVTQHPHFMPALSLLCLHPVTQHPSSTPTLCPHFHPRSAPILAFFWYAIEVL